MSRVYSVCDPIVSSRGALGVLATFTNCRFRLRTRSILVMPQRKLVQSRRVRQHGLVLHKNKCCVASSVLVTGSAALAFTGKAQQLTGGKGLQSLRTAPRRRSSQRVSGWRLCFLQISCFATGREVPSLRDRLSNAAPHLASTRLPLPYSLLGTLAVCMSVNEQASVRLLERFRLEEEIEFQVFFPCTVRGSFPLRHELHIMF